MAKKWVQRFVLTLPRLQLLIPYGCRTIPGKLGELTAHLEQEKKRRATADDGGPAVMAPVYIIKPASGLQGIGISLSTAPDKSKPAASGKE